MIETIGFYMSAFWLRIIKFLPMALVGIVVAIVVWLAVCITRHVTDRHWEKYPEKRKLAVRIKLKCYEQDIERLSDELDTLKKENAELRATIRGGIEQIQRAGNILGVER